MSLVIDGHLLEETTVDTGVSQGSLVSLILFALYLCLVFKEVEQEFEGYLTTLFADNSG